MAATKKDPKDLTFSKDPKVNAILHKVGNEFLEGMKNEDPDEENLHELDESVPLEKRDDHLG